MLKLLKRWVRKFARDDGVAGMVVAMIISIAAFSALAVFLSAHGGPAREIVRQQEVLRSTGLLLNAVMVNFIQNGEVVCPDTNFNGTSDPCSANPTSIGTLPWADLGLGRNDAVDIYGRHYTYVTISTDATRALCTGVTSDYSGAIEYTGEVISSTALELRLTSETTPGTGRYIPFAIISHGKNGAGGRVNATTTIPGAAGNELANTAAETPDVVYSGPFNSSAAAATSFDDVVEAPTLEKIQKLCEDLSPGGAKNATLGEEFSTAGAGTGGFNSDKWDTAGISASQQAGGRAQFTGTEYLATLLTSEFSPSVRPIYVSAYWTPSAGSSYSIVTRATGDGTTTGVTVQFAAGGVSINDGTALGSSPALTITAGRKYLLEVYDNGSDIWGRATQVIDPTITQTHRATTSAALTGEQRVLLKNVSGTNLIDDVLIGYPMLALEASATGYATADAAGTNGTTTDLTLEAWVKPSTLTGDAYIISQWNGAAGSSFRLYRSGSSVMFSVRDTGGQQADFDLGISLQANTWAHVAVTYAADAGNVGTVRSYKNGLAARTLTSATVDQSVAPPTLLFRVGADSDAVAGNHFSGSISDVRVWQSARAAADIASCYQRRLGATGACSGASTNWRLEPTPSQGFAHTVANATPGGVGTVQAGAWAPSMSVFFRPTSEDLCDGFKAGAYQCDYRVAGADDITLPDTVISLYAKAWGGGADYDGSADGGGGEYDGVRIDNAGVQIDINVGDHGAAGSATTVSRSAVTLLTAPGGATGTGLPNAENNGDPHYSPSYLSGTPGGNQNPGRGGSASPTAGNPGAVVLLW